MYTITVDEFHTFSFENKDSAIRFTALVQNMGSKVEWKHSNVFESCEDAMKDYRKLHEAQEQVKMYNVDTMRCTHDDERESQYAPCIHDFTLSCVDCEYWK